MCTLCIDVCTLYLSLWMLSIWCINVACARPFTLYNAHVRISTRTATVLCRWQVITCVLCFICVCMRANRCAPKRWKFRPIKICHGGFSLIAKLQSPCRFKLHVTKIVCTMLLWLLIWYSLWTACTMYSTVQCKRCCRIDSIANTRSPARLLIRSHKNVH